MIAISRGRVEATRALRPRRAAETARFLTRGPRPALRLDSVITEPEAHLVDAGGARVTVRMGVTVGVVRGARRAREAGLGGRRGGGGEGRSGNE